MSVRKKISIIGGSLFGLFAIMLLLYVGAKMYYSELWALSERWDLYIPKSTKLEEYHEELGFTGDGNTIFVVTCQEEDRKKFIFNYKNFNSKLSAKGKSIIQKCYEAFPDKKVSKVSNLSKSRSIIISKNYNNYLLIVYDEITTKYFIFEDLS